MKKWFPKYYLRLKEYFNNDKIAKIYNHTSKLVEKLLILANGTDEDYNIREDNIIKKVREVQPVISYIRPEDFYNINNDLSEEFFKKNELMKLFDKFSKFKPLLESIKEENKNQ